MTVVSLVKINLGNEIFDYARKTKLPRPAKNHSKITIASSSKLLRFIRTSSVNLLENERQEVDSPAAILLVVNVDSY